MANRILFLLVFLTALFGCKNQSNVSVTGTIAAPEKEFIKVWKVDINVAKLIDSARVKENGTFKIKFSTSEPEFFQLGYNQSDFITLLVFPGDKISLAFDNSQLQNSYKVDGSPESDKIRILDMQLAMTRKKLDSLKVIFDAENEDPSSVAEPGKTDQEIYDVIMAQRRYNIDFVLKNLSSLSSIRAIYQKLNDESYVLYDQRDLQIMKLLSDTLLVKYPGSRQVKAMSDDFNRELKNLQIRQMQSLAETLEPTELNPDLVSIEGRRIALSSLRGKYVLLTFWSANSNECITSNLQMKQFYQQYRKKGFEIYQINLDPDEQRWRDAVKFDELPWISVREDDPANPRNAQLFNVKTLPTNYLFSPEGEIIASNLHGRSLAIKLEQIFGI
jgi:hypothetical protein